MPSPTPSPFPPQEEVPAVLANSCLKQSNKSHSFEIDPSRPLGPWGFTVLGLIVIFCDWITSCYPLRYYKSFFPLNGLQLNRCARSASFYSLQSYSAWFPPSICSSIPFFEQQSPQQKSKETQLDVNIFSPTCGSHFSSSFFCNVFQLLFPGRVGCCRHYLYYYSFATLHLGFAALFQGYLAGVTNNSSLYPPPRAHRELFSPPHPFLLK